MAAWRPAAATCSINWNASINPGSGKGCAASSCWNRNAGSATKPPANCASTSAAWLPTHPASPAPSVPTGPSRTACTGAWMSASTTTRCAPAPRPQPIIWRCSNTLPSTLSDSIRSNGKAASKPGDSSPLPPTYTALNCSDSYDVHAIALEGETDPRRLALLGDDRLRCSEEQLVDALTGRPQPMHREMLALQLERLQLIDRQIEKLNGLIAQAMKPHQETVIRLAEVPGLGVDSAQQVMAEVGVQASTFPSAAQLTSWVGTCPGKDESAEVNHSSRSAKGNKYLRRILNQAAHAAVKKKGSHFQAVFRRLLPRLGYKCAIWAIAHRLCRVIWKILHEGVRFIEQGRESDPKVREHRARNLARALRKLGYDVALTPIHPAVAAKAVQS